MNKQPEQILENNLVKHLESLTYKFVTIANEEDLLANLKLQIEKHNNVHLTDKEFSQVINHLDKGNASIIV